MTVKKRKLVTGFTLLSAFLFLPSTLICIEAESMSIGNSLEKNEIQQTGRLSGVVFDESGSPIIGANILISGTTVGTTTDVDGKFSFEIPQNSKKLVVSFIGYKTKEVILGKERNLKIVLSEDSEALDEVVVIGYGTKTKRELTGAITKVSASELVGVSGRSDISTALQGRTSGVQITSQGGSPDGEVRIRVRGNSSINSSGDPLIVIDGVPVSNSGFGGASGLSSINAEDIESVEVLKDAAAAAIYGSRAANGVLLITSKKGKKGKTTVNANYEYGALTVAKRLDMLSGDEYVSEMDRAISNRKNMAAIGGSKAYNIFPVAINGLQGFSEEWVRSSHPNTKWLDQIYGSGNYNKVNIAVSGGEEKTTFYLSGSYRGDRGMLKGDNSDRITGRLNVEHIANKWFKAGANVSITNTVRNRNTGDFAAAHTSLLPIYPLYRPNNAEEYFGDYFDNTTGNINPVFRMQESSDNTNSFRSLNTLYAQINPITDFNIRYEFGVDYGFNQRREYMSMLLYPKDAPGNKGGGNGFVSNGRFQNMTLSNTITTNYTKKFADIHRITAMVGVAYESSKNSGNSNVKEGFQTETQKIDGSQYIAGNESENETRFASYFGRVSYSYNNRYMFEGSFRRDGSNRFGPGNRWGNFKGFSLGWILSEESFMSQTSDYLNFLKLRASYGETGNAEIGAYRYLSSAYVDWNNAKYAGYAGILAKQIGDKNLGWEVTRQTNIGLDYGLFENRINGSIEYYHKKSTNLLMNVPGSHSYGWEQTSLLANVGELSSHGFEFNISATVINRKSFSWITEFNIATNKSTVDRLVRDKGANYPGYFTVQTAGYYNGGIVMEGKSLGTYYLPKFAGIDPITGHEYIYELDRAYFETTGETRTTGNLIDATRYGTTIANQNCFVTKESSQPKLFGGWSNKFKYKGLDLSFMFYYQSGNHIYDASEMSMSYAKEEGGEMLESVKDLPLIYGQPQITSTRFLHDASFIRLKNLQIGYTLPKSFTNRAALKAIRIYASAENLWTITKYKGYDPEFFTGSGVQGNVMPGIYNFQLPQPRIFSLGASIDL